MPRVEENPSFLDQLRTLRWTGDSDRQKDDKLSLAFLFICGDKNDEDSLSQTDRLFQVIVWLAEEGLIQALIDSSFLPYFYSQCYALGLYEDLLSRLKTVTSSVSSDSVAVSADSDEVEGIEVKNTQLLVDLARRMEAVKIGQLAERSRQTSPVVPLPLRASAFQANQAFFLGRLNWSDLIPLLAGNQDEVTALLRDIQQKRLVEGAAMESTAKSIVGWTEALQAVLAQPLSTRTFFWLDSFAASCDGDTLDRCPLALCVLPYKKADGQVTVLNKRNLDALFSKTMRSLLSLPSKKLVMRLLGDMYQMFARLLGQHPDKRLVSETLFARCREAIVSTLFAFYAEGGALDIQREVQEDRQLIEAFRACELLEIFTAKLKECTEQIFKKTGAAEVDLVSLRDRWVGQEPIRGALLAVYPELRHQNDYPWTQHELFVRDLIRLFGLYRDPDPVDIFKLYFERLDAYLRETDQDVAQLPKLFETVLLVAFTLSVDKNFQQAILTKIKAMQPSEAGTIPWYEDKDRSDGISVVDRLGSRGNQSGLSLLLTTYQLSTSTLRNCLIRAARAGQEKMVDMLVNLPEPDQPDAAAVSNALRAAARAGQWDVVRFLVNLTGENQPDAAAVSNALHDAALAGQLEIVKLLLNLTGTNQPDALAVISALIAAAAARQWDVVRLLVSLKGENQPDAGTVGYALAEAAGAGQLQMVDMLVDLPGANQPNAGAVSNALIAAARAKEWGVVRFLLDPTRSNQPDVAAVSIAIVEAARFGQEEIVHFWVEPSRSNQPDAGAVSVVLVAAARAKEWSLVSFLVSLTGTNQPDVEALSLALVHAASAREWGMVRLLVSLKGANQPDAAAVSSALVAAASTRKWDVVSLLVDSSRLNQFDAETVSFVLRTAAGAGQEGMVKFLLTLEGKNKPDARAVGHALRAAAAVSAALRAAASGAQMEVVDVLLKLEGTNRPDAAAVGEALFGAARAGQREMVEFLVSLTGENRPDAEAVSRALNAASLAGQLDVVRFLVSLPGANQPDAEAIGKALGLAVRARQREMVEFLLSLQGENQPDAEAVNSALNAASRVGQLDVVRLLVSLTGVNQPTAAAVSRALCAAVDARQLDVVRLLVSLTGANQPTAAAVSRALCAAVDARQLDVVHLLVSLTGANQPDIESIKQALQKAVRAKQWEIAHRCLLASGGNMAYQLAAVINAAIESLRVPTAVVHTSGLFPSRPERDKAAPLCIQAALCAGTGLSIKEITIICSVENPDNLIYLMCAPGRETAVTDFLQACNLSFETEKTDNGNKRWILNRSPSPKNSYG